MPADAPELPFRDLVDAAPDGVIVCDQAGLIVLVNAETERMFGYQRNELIGQRIDVLVPDRARVQHSQHVARYTGLPRLRPMGIGMELTGRRRDGTEIPVEISLSPIQTSRGLLVTAGIRDVTDRRKLERDNRRANAYLVSAVDSVRDAFALFDEHDRVIMDINLPGMSGFDAVQRLREWPETRSIPVIGLSAAALLKDTTRARDVGFYRYLT